jgi:hypothetical protein
VIVSSEIVPHKIVLFVTSILTLRLKTIVDSSGDYWVELNLGTIRSSGSLIDTKTMTM